MRNVYSYLVFDFETTGLEPDTHRIIQVGLCVVSEGRVIDKRGWLVNQDVEVSPDATRIHGITTGDIRARGIPPHESLTRLFQAMDEAPVCIGHNVHRFDVRFMLAEARRLCLQAPDCSKVIDTAALYKGWKLGMPRKPGETFEAYADRILSIRTAGLKYSVAACVRELRIQANTARLHDASQDAYLTHLIFQALQATP